MYKHNIRTTLLEHITKSCEHSCSYIGEILTLLHDVEINVGSDPKDLKYLIEHFTMLTGYAYNSLKLF